MYHKLQKKLMKVVSLCTQWSWLSNTNSVTSLWSCFFIMLCWYSSAYMVFKLKFCLLFKLLFFMLTQQSLKKKKQRRQAVLGHDKEDLRNYGSFRLLCHFSMASHLHTSVQRCNKRGIEHDAPIHRYYERLATVQARGSQASHQVVRDILKEAQTNMVPRGLLKEWAVNTFLSATDYWTFRKTVSCTSTLLHIKIPVSVDQPALNVCLLWWQFLRC